MTTTNQTRPERRIQTPSGDLSQRLGPRTLLKLVLDAVQTIDPGRFDRADRGRALYRPQMLLTLLAYCYAARIYGSRDIEWATRHDKTVRYICARTFPDWNALRRFRRRNRALVEQTLAYVCKQVCALQCNECETARADDRFDSELDYEVRKEAFDRIEIAALMDAAEND